MSTVPEELRIPLPATLPVMILRGGILFPRQGVTLRIFEMRYRAMLRRALATDRMLAIASPLRESEEELAPVGCAGLVRACVLNADGTFHLILWGLYRVQFKQWLPAEPFPLAEVRVHGSLHPEGSPQERAERLKRLQGALEGFLRFMPPELAQALKTVGCPEALTDTIAAHMLGAAPHRQALLEEASGARREELLLRLLKDAYPE